MRGPQTSVPSGSVGSVLVLTKYRFMGDTVVATPLLRGVRRAFPDARVTLLTGKAAAAVLHGCPFLDRVVCYDPYETQRGMAEFLRLVRSLRRPGRPDLCVVADRSMRSALAAFLCGGRVRAGFNSEGRAWLLTHPVPYDPARREIECYLDILRAVAPERGEGPPYDASPELWITGDERARGAQILAEREALGPLLVGLQPGASYAAKQWSPEGFAAVADALAEDGAGIVLVGGPDEAEAARAVCQAMRAPAVNLTGATSLRETMGVLSHLTLFVGNDTGVNHIAAALGVPTVGLFGPTSAPKWGNVGPRAAVLAAPEGQIDRIRAEDVLAAARRLLAGGPRPAAGARR